MITILIVSTIRVGIYNKLIILNISKV